MSVDDQLQYNTGNPPTEYVQTSCHADYRIWQNSDGSDAVNQHIVQIKGFLICSGDFHCPVLENQRNALYLSDLGGI